MNDVLMLSIPADDSSTAKRFLHRLLDLSGRETFLDLDSFTDTPAASSANIAKFFANLPNFTAVIGLYGPGALVSENVKAAVRLRRISDKHTMEAALRAGVPVITVLCDGAELPADWPKDLEVVRVAADTLEAGAARVREFLDAAETESGFVKNL